MHWLKSLFVRTLREQEFERELQFHIEEVTRDFLASGMTPEEAHRRAMLEFGGKEQTTQSLRDVYVIPVLERAWANVKSGFHLMRSAPSFSIAVILTLAFGIGANSAVFSAIDAILLRPLPFPHGDQLMRIEQHHTKDSNPSPRVAPARLEDWSRLNSTFQALNGYYTEDVSETTGSFPEKVTRAWVAQHFFEVWDVPPALGREFSSA